jgi:hypothetical protein
MTTVPRRPGNLRTILVFANLFRLSQDSLGRAEAASWEQSKLISVREKDCGLDDDDDTPFCHSLYLKLPRGQLRLASFWLLHFGGFFMYKMIQLC